MGGMFIILAKYQIHYNVLGGGGWIVKEFV